MPVETRTAYGGGRVTSARTAIAEVVCGMPGAFTVEELSDAVRAAFPDSGSTATVYRAVAAMEAAGFLERVGSRHGSALFARCECSAHHHHIVCESCGTTARALCPLGPEITNAAASEGFEITRHEVTFYGLCRSCATNRED